MGESTAMGFSHDTHQPSYSARRTPPDLLLDPPRTHELSWAAADRSTCTTEVSSTGQYEPWSEPQ